MGNETSSVRIHSALSGADIQGLRSNFPGGGNGEPPTKLDFGLWPLWQEELRSSMEQQMSNQEGKITFHAYQEMAGSTVRGASEDRVKFLFRLLHVGVEKHVRLDQLQDVMCAIIGTAATIVYNRRKTTQSKDDASRILAQSLLSQLAAPTQVAKELLHLEFPNDFEVDFDTIERWMVMKTPLFEQIMQFVFAKTFGLNLAGSQSCALHPTDGISLRVNTSLSAEEVFFLNHHLGVEHRRLWRPLFNSSVQGESFSKLTAAVLKQGPSLIVVTEQNGHKFGGFASDSWRLGPKFYGQNTCFLFSLRPRMLVYEALRFNSNYQYMNLKQKTMPNGLGMGGQLDYFGLWLDSEYGKGRCAPSCSSFQSPQLSRNEHFHVAHLEVWGLGELRSDDDQVDAGTSALDLDPEAQAVMEMMGKTFVSKDVRAADEQQQKEQS